MEAESPTLLSALGKISKWAIVSLAAGALLTLCIYGILHLIFPAQISDWNLNFLNIWLLVSLMVGIPPHFNHLIDPDLGCFGNLFVQGFTALTTGLLLFGIALLITLVIDKSSLHFLLASWLGVITSLTLYSFCLQFCDAVWRKLMAVLP
ncbi:MAG TPA: hypothetical protein VF837_02470 [Patescibacteria group bacterium]